MSGNQGSQMSSTSPWKPTQPHLKDIMGYAQEFYDEGQGFNPFPGKGYVGMSDQTQGALGGMWSAAQKEDLGRQSAGQLGDMIGAPGGGLSTRDDFTRLLRNAPTSFGDDYARMGGQGPNAIASNLGGVAGGQHSLGTMTNLESLYGQAGQRGAGTTGRLEGLLGQSSNPAFEAMVEQNVGNTRDDVNREFSMGGRYGSGAHVGALTDSLGDLRSRMTFDNYNQNLQNQRGLLGDIQGVGGQTLGQQQGLLGDIRGVRQGDLSNRMNAAGMLSGEQQQGFANQMGVLGARAGQEQQGWENQRGAMGDLTNVEQQGIGNQFGALDRVGQTQENLYDRFGRMGQVGSAYDDLATRRLQSEMDQWTQSQQEPWNRLGAYSGLVGGFGGMGGQTTQTATAPSNPWGSALGGGMMGFQAGGPLGGLLGGGLGLLSGLF